MQMWMAMVGLTFFMWLFSASLELPIGNTAHLGGLLLGVAYGIYLKVKYPRKTQMISRYFGGN
jgi:membrane associated rhomboid family serine protease